MKIAINGAGVAGPTLAWWLRKAGHEPVIFERAPALRTGGYLIDFWGYGYDVAEQMGLIPELKAQGYVMEHLISRNAAGRQTSHLSGKVFLALTEGRYFSIARSALAEQIWRAGDGIETRFGTGVTGLVQDGDGVTVTLNSGAEERYDMVVGADGLHSAVRAQAFGPEEKFLVSSGISVAAFVLQGFPHRDERSFVTYSEPNRQVARISLDDDQTMFLLAFKDDLLPDYPHGEAAQKAAIHEVFDGMKGETPEVLARLDDAPDIYFDPVAQIRMERWHQGRVGLIGDAAACASLLAGEGTSLAMLEAWVLAQKLEQTGGDPDAAFAATHAALAPLIASKQAAALRFAGFFAPKNAFGIWLRDKAISLSGMPGLARLFVAPMVRKDHELADF